MSGALIEEQWQRMLLGYRANSVLEKIGAQGLYRGGEKLIEDLLGPDTILNRSLQEILQAGIEATVSDRLTLLTPESVSAAIINALDSRTGLAIVRLGDGELLTLAHGTVLPTHVAMDLGAHFLPYAGVHLPDGHLRDRIASAILHADIIGVPTARLPTFHNLFISVASHFNWPLATMRLTNSLINYKLAETTTLYQQILANHKTVLVGNKMPEFGTFLKNRGYRAPEAVFVVNGTSEATTVLTNITTCDFEVALVSAGVAALEICVGIRQLNRIAIDFGHLADQFIREQRF